MKRICKIAVLLCLIVSLTACSAISNLFYAITGNIPMSREPKLFREAMDSFFAAVDAGDRDAIRELFSVNAQKECADLDERINRLFECYAGPTDVLSWDELGSGTYYSGPDGHTAFYESTFVVISGGVYYWCHLGLTYQNDFDPDEVGITQLLLYSAADYCALRYDEEACMTGEPGLFVYFDRPSDDNIRCVEGNPYLFTSETGLDEDEVKDFLQSSDSFSEFTQHFGQPNAYCIYHIYQLPSENGEARYLELVVDDWEDRIDSVWVADDFRYLYSVWESDAEG